LRPGPGILHEISNHLPGKAKKHLLHLQVESKTLSEYFKNLSGDIWEFLPTCARAIQSRFERDARVREAAYQRLEKGATPSEKVNFSLLLRRTDLSIDRLRTWCQKELQLQKPVEHLPDFALDIFSGRFRPVGHVLLEILTS